MLDKGSIEAPKWWHAANSQPRKGSRKLVPHAEDSVEYLANQYYGPTFNDDSYEQARLIVYGFRHSNLDMARLCENELLKNPTCKDIAQILNIEFLPRGVSVAQMDRPGSLPANPPGNSGQGQDSGHTDSSNYDYTYSHGDPSGGYQAALTGRHGGGYGSTSYHYHNHSDGNFSPSNLQLREYGDASFASSLLMRVSARGHVIMIGNCPVIRKTKMKVLVALYRTETELINLMPTALLLNWVTNTQTSTPDSKSSYNKMVPKALEYSPIYHNNLMPSYSQISPLIPRSSR